MNDLINRQAAIDAIESHIRVAVEPYQLTRADEILNHAFEVAASCVYNLPPAEPNLQQTCNNLQPTCNWTPCAERLPEASGAYLVTCANGNVRVGHFATFDGKWTDAKAVAWMPLPEAYEGGDGHGEQ